MQHTTLEQTKTIEQLESEHNKLIEVKKVIHSAYAISDLLIREKAENHLESVIEDYEYAISALKSQQQRDLERGIISWTGNCNILQRALRNK